MTHRTAIVVLVALAALPSITRGQTHWTITTADFKTITATALELDDAGPRATPEAGGEPQAIGWDQFLLADRADPGSARPPGGGGAPFVLSLATGDQLAGKPAGVSNEAVKWQTPAAGDVTVPLRQVRAMTRAGQSSATASNDVATTEDVVTLANGDAVRGIVTDLTADAVTITPTGGDAIPVPLDSVAAVRFAAAGGAAAANNAGKGGGRTFRVRLTDGSALTGTAVRLTGKELTLTLAGGETRKIAADTVAGIEQLNGPVAWLSSLAPSENVHTPFLDTAWPARMDRTVRGDPIRVSGRVVSRGIGVHSRSKLTWPLDGTYAAFRTQYAIDGDYPYANVTVRVKLDDKVVHEQTDVTAGPPSQVVQVPLEGAKTLTLEVDYGQAYDVQDRFVWIEPALLRTAPPTK